MSDATDTAQFPLATQQDGTYPRPQLMRASWTSLDGEWRFAYDDADRGLSQRWAAEWPSNDRAITVPYPPESEASGIGDIGYHPVVWYHREFGADEVAGAGGIDDDRCLFINFGAVDYRATVWVDGHLAGTHEGGQTPFSLDVTDAVAADPGGRHTVTVRAEDQPRDLSQPRGKQDWEPDQHVIWYHRTTGIWQPVWLESRPRLHVERLTWRTAPDRRSVSVGVRLNATPADPTPLHVVLGAGCPLADVSAVIAERETTVTLPLPAAHEGKSLSDLLWHPAVPVLHDAFIDVGRDRVSSYVGIRTTAVDGGRFTLNGWPLYVRAVLEQGYWPTSHLAAPSPDALRREVDLILQLGFNTARIHQKYEDPRFLFWADKLGLMVWGEAPAPYGFTPLSAERTTAEWLEAVGRDASHPSIVTWVPFNESWGVEQIATDEVQRRFARGLCELTRGLDPTRPVVDNDGWELGRDTDIAGLHDYEGDPSVLADRYGSRASVDALLTGAGPQGKRGAVPAPSWAPDAAISADTPVMLTEFGGISYTPAQQEGSWGYTTATDAGAYEAQLRAQMQAIQSSPVLAGLCYTQLTDTGLETNGLLTADRTPKLDIAVLRSIVTGEDAPPTTAE